MTAQGESNASAFANKVYLNTGPVDDLPPVVVALDDPSPRSGGASYVVHARVRDQVMDDGKSWVTGRASWVVRAAEVTEPVALGGSSFSPASTTVVSGTTVVFTNASGSLSSVANTTPGYDSAPQVLAPGASLEVALIVAGNYVFEGPAGAFQAAISVVGPHEEVLGLDQGGGQYRFELDGGPAVALCYELAFDDAAGNRTVVPGRCVPGGGYAGQEFCFGDGGPTPGCTPCGCGNEALPGTIGGCLNGVGSSARLLAAGSPGASSDTLTLRLTAANPISFAVLTSGSNRLPNTPANPCAGYDSGTASAVLDGLRCVGGATLRHGSRAIDANGDTGIANAPWQNLVAGGGFVAGQTRHFQGFYR